MAKQDPSAPDSQEEEAFYELVPFESFYSLDAGFWEMFIREPIDASIDLARDNFKGLLSDERYQNLPDKFKNLVPDVSEFKKSIKDIFQVRSNALSLDGKFRVDIVNRIKNSRTIRTCGASWWNEKLCKAQV